MSKFFPTVEECGRHVLFGCVQARTYTGEHLQLSLCDIQPGGEVAWHSHPQEQIGIVMKGSAIFYIGEEEKTLLPGDMYLMPGGVRHRVVALSEGVLALDVFSPIREEYR